MDISMKSLVIAAAVLLRLGTSLHSYSGEAKPPLYGDFEAQRHWQEITVNLPATEWYVNSTNNDLLYWGLDYPPLTAYHSLLCGKIASYINEDFTSLHNSRGIESTEHKLFMRYTVIVADLFLFLPSVLYFWRIFESIYLYKDENSIKHTQRNINKCDTLIYLSMVLFYPGLILIDHGHFQYNGVSLGFAIFAIAFLMKNKNYKASVAFVLALNYKQMELYHAIPIFIYLLSTSFKSKTIIQGVLEIIKLGVIVLVTFFILWFPFIWDFKVFTQVIHRLFPFARGIFEDKVSNVWCAVNVVVKLKSLLDTKNMALLCAALTLLSTIPSNIILFIYPTKINLKYCLFNTSLAFFLFSFQVHEKSILLAAIPALLLFKFEPLVVFWFSYISSFSMLPLLIKDQLYLPYWSLNIIYSLIFVWYCLQNHSRDASANIFALRWTENLNSNMFSAFVVKMVFHISIFVTIILSVASVLIKPPMRYPDLFPLLISVASCLHFLMFFIYFNFKLFYLNIHKSVKIH